MSRRKRRLPIASAGGASPRIKLDNADWRDLEGSLGKPIPRQLRKEIAAATNGFLKFASMENRIEPADGAEARVRRLKHAANELLKALVERGQSESDFYANHIVKMNFENPAIRGPIKFGQLDDVLISLILACKRAEEDLKQALEWHPGDSWNVWIKNLTSQFRQHDLPWKVRKDTDKNKSGSPSKFVEFVGALQKHIPERLVWGLHSPIALSEAITKARRV